MVRMIILCSLFAMACSDDSSDEPPPFTAYVHGPLGADVETSRAKHDGLVDATQSQAVEAGDRGHRVLLGTGDPVAAKKDEFLAIDEWLTLEGAQATYGDPNFQAAFGAIFAAPVIPELYQRRPDWVTWGDLKGPPDGKPYWFMIVKGRMAKATLEENKAAHDAVAGGFEEAAKAAGDIAHVPHISISDPKVFWNVDVATSKEAHLQTLANPQFGQAFGALFESPPEIHIYQSTNWKQW